MPRGAAADEPGNKATVAGLREETPESAETRPTDENQRRPTTRTASNRQSEGDGTGFPRRPFLGMPNVVVTDPASYPRPQCLENNDPSSFWYSSRPNIFNVPVEPEWDFFNLINTDRPDFTDAVYSVGKGVTYLETGFTYSKHNTIDQDINTRQLPESLLRYGITDEFEIRLKWPGYLLTNVRDPQGRAQASTFGSEDIDTGFKWEILQQRGWRPMTTLVAGMTLPTGAPNTSANFVQPHFNLLAGWGLRRWLYLKCQTGCDFVHSSTKIVTPLAGASNPTFITVRSPPNSWHESISLLTQWTKRVGAFHEWFMISGTGGGDTRAQHFLDMGLYLYATPNVQFDVRVGRQLSNRVDDFFTGAGFSGRW
ncbi:MAG: transporter [Pirellulales bacterium]